MCGEKHNRSYQQGLERGSAPHVRGKGSGGNGPLFDGGITPACAGKRFDQRRQFVESEDHPRMCGEKGGVLRRAPQRPGSPPHVRGKVGLRLIAAQDDGITPACAGKSEPPGSGLGASGDHPRVCGEKLNRPAERIRQVRITPAYAGKSVLFIRVFNITEDHPRVCGEKKSCQTGDAWRLGSPPRMRGKGMYRGRLTPPPGITPAYAGKSFVYSCYGAFNRDHPRVCGEKI